MAEKKSKAKSSVQRNYNKIKVLEKTVGIEFSEGVELEDEHILNNYTTESKHAVHEDFKNALDDLKPHLALILDYSSVDSYKDVPEELLEEFKMTGFSISGSDESEGVILTGMKKRKQSGQFFNCVTPLIRFENLESYSHVGELYHDIGVVKKEADQYLKGKFGAGTQWSLSFDKKMEEAE